MSFREWLAVPPEDPRGFEGTCTALAREGYVFVGHEGDTVGLLDSTIVRTRDVEPRWMFVRNAPPNGDAEALEVLLEHAKGTMWEYEDNGANRHTCYGCGWDSQKDRRRGDACAYACLDHKPGCPLVAAIAHFERKT